MCFTECLRTFPIIAFLVPLPAAVVCSRPREPGAIHFDAKYDNHRMTKTSRSIRPHVDVRVPPAGKNFGQTEFVRRMILRIWLVPWGPKDQRQRTVPPNDVEITYWKILFSPITRRSDDSLVFAHHLLKILDCLEGHVILFVAKIHKRAGVCTSLGEHNFNRAIRINFRDSHAAMA